MERHGKIALEEHFVTPALEHCIAPVGWPPDAWRRVIAGLHDVDERLRQMDALDIERSVLSLGSDGIQGIASHERAIATAREANDALAELVASRPDRFSGFAAIPLQDPGAAADELGRAVGELGFVGALANGFSELEDGSIAYYDQPEYAPFWARVAELGVPFYLHPRNPLPAHSRMYEGRPELLGPAWAFGVETGTHALRLITSGLFDRHPDLQIILGHLGENLPFAIARLEQRIAHREDVAFERPPRTVLRENFHLTISGNYHTASLIGILLELGADRVLFAADHPFERMEDAARWFDALPISPADRAKIAHGNATRLLGPAMNVDRRAARSILRPDH
ncbi:MAG TPA: amidohydrolase family protein [Microbacterium sp.]|uniref:amidohydrolase family protein n=1 Tax=Microbacterium sp. TaxID=51671 RepID=UPI002C596C39|nr:amidohydrolase family protein [Microbacterium sp.]HWI30573.1 amidohydrolase family protein [Microbacterium sp.]